MDQGMRSKMKLGTFILVPSQAFSMCLRWMLEVIAYFDQLGFLIITPLISGLVKSIRKSNKIDKNCISSIIINKIINKW
jgi:hypothetical protein